MYKMKAIWNKWNNIIMLKIWNTKLNWAMFVTKLRNYDDQKLKSKVCKQESRKKKDRNGYDTTGK
jgi:hypothetical protein